MEPGGSFARLTYDNPWVTGGGSDPTRWAVRFGAVWLRPFAIRIQDEEVHLRYSFLLPGPLTHVRYTGPARVFVDDIGDTIVVFLSPIPVP